MSTAALPGIGTKVYYWDLIPSTAVWAALSQVTSVGGPEKSRDEHEVTDLDSTEGYKEFIGGLRDSGEVPLDMFFTKAQFEILNGQFEDDTNMNYKIVFPDTDETTMEFEGFIKSLGTATAVADLITCTVAFRVTGKIAISDGSSGTPIS